MADQEREIQRVISYIRSCRDAGIDTTITIDKNRNHFILNALEEIQQYRAIGTVEECREATERQREKKPIKIENNGFRYTDSYICPNCEKGFTGTGIADFCYHCGQAIDWSDAD